MPDFSGLALEGPEFVKGHGTENDFVILPDPRGELDLTDSRVRALCDRRRGLGADGVLRVVRTENLADAPASVAADTWFMDYRNADGSVAEMCGNGVRVFGRYLVDAGWVRPGEIPVGTRAGPRSVSVGADGRVTVDMGPATVFGESTTSVNDHRMRGLALDLGNPHLACVTDVDPEVLDLSEQPPFDQRLFPNGVNLEFVHRIAPEAVRMRVYERGVGETRSCGTGIVAAAVGALRADGHEVGNQVVRVRGGTAEVEVTSTSTTLTGPAVLVSSGRLSQWWWHHA